MSTTAPGPVERASKDAPAYGDLRPAGVWKYFAELAAVPRPSFHEDAVQARILELARARGCDAKQDKAGNLVVYVPATHGRDDRPVLVIQAHTDMVSVKRDESGHDFLTDPITLVTDLHEGEPIVRAKDTTLGADNGIGAACALAMMESDLPHPPLELLLTVNEESGMTGAKGLDGSLVTGRRMLNLDSEEDDKVYIGCVGGSAAFLSWSAAQFEPDPGAEFLEVTVSGLRGGHSGLEIHQPRGNANQILADVLRTLPDGAWSLARIAGGSLRNAIPARASAVVSVAPGAKDDFVREAQRIEAAARKALGRFGGALSVSIAPAAPEPTMGAEVSPKIAAAVAEAPHGVLAMDASFPDTVETSNNVAILRTQAGDGSVEVILEVSIRSLIRSKLDEICALYETLGKSHGAAVSTRFNYPPWEPNPDSELLTVAQRVHREVYDRTPRVASIHGGLECGILTDRLPGMDVISVGPLIQEAHTPDERVFANSVATFWDYLTKLLAAL